MILSQLIRFSEHFRKRKDKSAELIEMVAVGGYQIVNLVNGLRALNQAVLIRVTEIGLRGLLSPAEVLSFFF